MVKQQSVAYAVFKANILYVARHFFSFHYGSGRFVTVHSLSSGSCSLTVHIHCPQGHVPSLPIHFPQGHGCSVHPRLSATADHSWRFHMPVTIVCWHLIRIFASLFPFYPPTMHSKFSKEYMTPYVYNMASIRNSLVASCQCQNFVNLHVA